MGISKKLAKILAENCVSCGSCADVCPAGALSIYKGVVARVDEVRCVGCGACAKVCPADAIVIALREGTNES